MVFYGIQARRAAARLPALVDDILAVVGSEADGFGTTSGVFFSLTGEIDPAGLPDMPGSVAPDMP